MEKAFLTHRSSIDGSLSQHWLVSLDGEWFKEVSADPSVSDRAQLEEILNNNNTLRWARSYLVGFAETILFQKVE